MLEGGNTVSFSCFLYIFLKAFVKFGPIINEFLMGIFLLQPVYSTLTSLCSGKGTHFVCVKCRLSHPIVAQITEKENDIYCILCCY